MKKEDAIKITSTDGKITLTDGNITLTDGIITLDGENLAELTDADIVDSIKMLFRLAKILSIL